MSQELATVQKNSLANISKDDLMLELLRRQQADQKELKEAQLSTIKEVELLNANLRDLQDSHNKKLEKEFFIQSKIQSSDYITKTNLGQHNNPPLSAQSMTNLLRFAGIIQKHNGKPYAHFYIGKNPICIENKSVLKNGFETLNTHFHFQKTWEIIFKELESAGIKEDFLECKNYEELRSFVNRL